MALYANIAEGPGNIIGENDDSSQQDWLRDTARKDRPAPKRWKAEGAHLYRPSPAYSNGDHSWSQQMLV